jgi:membrane-bound ClpP family serine protease
MLQGSLGVGEEFLQGFLDDGIELAVVFFGVEGGAGRGDWVWGDLVLAGLVAMRARRNKRLLGPHAMVGKIAVALTPLAPTGQVEVRGEIWQASVAAGAGDVAAGTQVVVRGVDGLTLTVSP